jgi:putative DNA primase/helicase
MTKNIAIPLYDPFEEKDFFAHCAEKAMFAACCLGYEGFGPDEWTAANENVARSLEVGSPVIGKPTLRVVPTFRLDITFFPTQTAQSMNVKNMTLHELRDMIQTTTAKSKSALPWLKLASFGEKRTSTGCLRHNENVEEITGAEGDYDGKKMPFEEAVAITERAHLRALIYTSPSHTDEAPKWRILAPTSEPLQPSEREKLVARLNGLFGGIFDTASFALSQSFYFGSVNGNPAHRAIVVEGDFIDERNDLDAGAIGKSGEMPKQASNAQLDYVQRYAQRQKLEASIDKVARVLNAIPATGDRGHLVRVGQATYGATGGSTEGLALFDKWRSQAPGYDTSTVIQKWAGYRSKNIGYGTLKHIADTMNPGWETMQPIVDATQPGTKSRLVIVRASDIKMRAKDWLWYGHLMREGLELLTGQPGLGKSQVQIHYMACVTAGLPWPNGTPEIEPMNVLMVTAEDALETEIVPRLEAAKVDRTRLHIIQCIKTDKYKRQFLLAEDIAELELSIKQIGNVGLICIDPITAYMGGKMDSHKATEVRSQLGPLKDFAERTRVAVSAITHPPKNASARAIDHFIGSQAFIAAARIGHACFEEFDTDEETGEKTPTGRILFTHVKHNPSPQQPTLAYKLAETIVYQNDFPITSSRVMWEKEAVDINAEQAVAVGKNNVKGKAAGMPTELVNLMYDMIEDADGWCKADEIVKQAKALGYSDKEMRTVRHHFHIIAKREGGFAKDGWWEWGWEDGEKPGMLGRNMLAKKRKPQGSQSDG